MANVDEPIDSSPQSNDSDDILSLPSDDNSDDEQMVSDTETIDDDSQNEEECHEVWNFEKEFNSEEEVSVFIKAENTWSLRSSQELSSGKKFTYRCNKVKRTGPQCNARLYVQSVLKFDFNNGENAEIELKYQLYRKSSTHNHTVLGNKSTKVTGRIKDIIIDGFNNNKKPTAIAYQLRADITIPLNDQPTMRQIKNVIESYKKSVYGKDPITMRTLTEFVEQHMYVPEEDDDAFITMFERSPPDQKENKVFRFFITIQNVYSTML